MNVMRLFHIVVLLLSYDNRSLKPIQFFHPDKTPGADSSGYEIYFIYEYLMCAVIAMNETGA